MLAKFVPSGRVDATSILVAPAVIAIAAGLGWVYQILIEVIPFIYIDALLVAGLGFGIGLITAKSVKFGNCRNPIAAGLLGAAAGLAAVGVSHVAAYQHTLALAKAQGPVSVSDYLSFRTQVGWSVGKGGSGVPIKGPFVYVFWAVECLSVIGFAFAMGRAAGARPYCEECRRWADSVVTSRAVRTPGAAGVAVVRGADDIAKLLDLPAGAADAGGAIGRDELIYSLTACPACGGVATLAVQLKTVKLRHPKKKDVQTSTAMLHDMVLLAPSEVAMVKELVEGIRVGGDEPAADAGAQTAASIRPS